MASSGANRGQVILEASDVSLSFGPKVVLKDINVLVRDVTRPGFKQGQVVAFLGPSGIGKSQFSQYLAGMPESAATISGKITVNNPPQPVERGMVGMVDQHYTLFNHRTVWGNLMVAGKQASLSYKARTELALGYLKRFHLEDVKKMRPNDLSGGQRQRIAIIQQLMCSDHYLIMDEPFSGLDIVVKEEAMELIKELSLLDELNTIIVISHDIPSALMIADTVWLLGRERDAEGNILAQGATIKREHQIDLIERDLCYDPDIRHNPRFLDLVQEVEEVFRKL